MLNNKQKAYLKSLANPLKPLFQIGKDGINANLINNIDTALEAHELIKINALKTCNQSMQECAIEISVQTHCEVIQIIGRVLVLYRKSRDHHRIDI